MTDGEWRNRIIGHGEEDPAVLIDNPKNWRAHPEFQARALEGSLKELGWIQDVIVNRTTGRLIDGHLRVALARESKIEKVPVKYVELSEAEEALALAVFDPLSALAEANRNALDSLLQDVRTGNAALQELLSQTAQQVGLVETEAPESFPEVDENVETEFRCPKCGYEWSGKPS